ncbi:type II toxin-antitoxin system Phd/YefM family antitoxin [Treponema sp.]|uniref:type II toxin-antitoxin system Phd/YefM family antitoxin n=1 Tax=Treponema sp. TaxID=166 RepID=UPI00298E6EB5|nr:type II toxin-antitoxin system Phd/YefM family antitoxin [Treponema sp.]MCQ2242186.1 type II toxin-antitoxin system Phd/YefM family antitoxin [Treponema sp.]
MNAIPVFEAKNRLSYYLHLTDEQGPIFITNHGKPAYVIQSLEDYQKVNKELIKKSYSARIQNSRADYGLENDDFNYSKYYESIREEHPMVRDFEENMFSEDKL